MNIVVNNYYTLDNSIRFYSLNDLTTELQRESFKLSQRCTSELEYDLLQIRTEYLIHEILNKPDSDLCKTILGLFFISPYIVYPQLVSNGLNVFLARDSARDYYSALLLNRNKILKNSSDIILLSRRSLGSAYSITKKVMESESNFGEAYAILEKHYENDHQFKDKVDEVGKYISDVRNLGFRKINFFDTWAEGNIFFFINFVSYILKKNDEKLCEDMEIYFSVGNNKRNVKVVHTYQDYINVKKSLDFCWSLPDHFIEFYLDRNNKLLPHISNVQMKISEDQVRDWYQCFGTSPGRPFELNTFIELCSAQIVKYYNHFGSYNLGHPIDLKSITNQVVPASPDKLLGNHLRKLLITNAVVRFQEHIHYASD